MPDNVTVSLVANDELSPVLKKTQDELRAMAQSASDALRQANQELSALETRALSGGKAIGAVMREVKKNLSESAQPEKGGFAKWFSEEGKELLSGISYNLGLWNAGMMASQAILDVTTKAVGDLIGEFQTYYHWTNMLGGVNAATAQSFEEISRAAWQTGQSVADTGKRVADLYSHGFSTQEAVRSVIAINQTIHDTGIDLTDTYAKAKELSAGIEDLRKVGMAGHPELVSRAHAMALTEREDEQEMLHLQLRQTAETRAFEDRRREQQYALDDRVRNQQREFEDLTHGMEREMQLRHMYRNRDMEDAHLAIEREMAERHRLAEQAAQDADMLHSRQIGIASGIRGLLEATLVGQPFRPFGQVIQGMEGAQAALRQEMQRGLQQLQKDMGIGPQAAGQLIGMGIMSPQVLLQEAQAAREEQRKQEGRQRELESIKTGIRLQDEARKEAKAQQDEQLAMTERIYQTAKMMQRSNQDEQINFQRSSAAEALAMGRDYENERLAKEVKIANMNIERQQLISQAEEENRRKAEALLHEYQGFYGSMGWRAPEPEEYQSGSPAYQALSQERRKLEATVLPDSLKNDTKATDENTKAVQANTDAVIKAFRATADLALGPQVERPTPGVAGGPYQGTASGALAGTPGGTPVPQETFKPETFEEHFGVAPGKFDLSKSGYYTMEAARHAWGMSEDMRRRRIETANDDKVQAQRRKEIMEAQGDYVRSLGGGASGLGGGFQAGLEQGQQALPKAGPQYGTTQLPMPVMAGLKQTATEQMFGMHQLVFGRKDEAGKPATEGTLKDIAGTLKGVFSTS